MTFFAGDIIYAQDINRPITWITQQVAQSLANSTDTAITFGTGATVIDTDNFHDETTNNTRITPNRPGFYMFVGTLFLTNSAAITAYNATIARNGTVQAPRSRQKPAGTNVTCSTQVSVLLDMNGSTDYVELFGTQTSGGALNTTVGGSFTSSLLCYMVMPS